MDHQYSNCPQDYQFGWQRCGQISHKILSRIEFSQDGDDGVHYYKYIGLDSTALLLEKLRAPSTPEFNDVFQMISVVNKLEGSPVLIDGRLGVAPTTKSSEDIAKEI